jgi:predicted DNA-binding transcriptional regulator YafY
MSQKLNALIRFNTIDVCLQNKSRSWTLEDLIEACSEALHKYDNKAINVSKRTVQLDIQMLRSKELGFNAPIEVYERKYYRYADENYSIKKLPLTDYTKSVISEGLELLSQFKGYSFYDKISLVEAELKNVIENNNASDLGVKVVKFTLKIDKSIKEKVLGKPLHKSQKLKQEKKNGSIVIQLKVTDPDKLKVKILPYGELIKVVSSKTVK